MGIVSAEINLFWRGLPPTTEVDWGRPQHSGALGSLPIAFDRHRSTAFDWFNFFFFMFDIYMFRVFFFFSNFGIC